MELACSSGSSGSLSSSSSSTWKTAMQEPLVICPPLCRAFRLVAFRSAGGEDDLLGQRTVLGGQSRVHVTAWKVAEQQPLRGKLLGSATGPSQLVVVLKVLALRLKLSLRAVLELVHRWWLSCQLATLAHPSLGVCSLWTAPNLEPKRLLEEGWALACPTPLWEPKRLLGVGEACWVVLFLSSCSVVVLTLHLAAGLAPTWMGRLDWRR